jgi:hypothetical protein
MYFITKQDPNYTVKGSRDPLGFQVIWQTAGRKLIPHLSTVSVSVKDFQILSTAHYYKKELNIGDSEFEAFFMLFEQLMAYTRYTSGDDGFNGIDRVKKVFSASPNEVRISLSEQILANQKSHGIWGKYIRPFTGMGIKEATLFNDIYKAKYENNADLLRQVNTLRKKVTGETSKVSLQRLHAFKHILAKPEKAERELFISSLLSDHCNGELLHLFTINPALKELDFYELLQALGDASISTNLKAILQFINNTESVLSPLNRIFRYLQTRSFWKRTEIDSDTFISAWRSGIDTGGFTDEMKNLSALLSSSNWDLVHGLVHRNEKVCNNRGSAPWIKVTPTGIDMNYFEGAFFRKDYNPSLHNDNTYFLNTYINLHNQLI